MNGRFNRPGCGRTANFLLAVFATLLFSGCAQKSYIVLLPSPDGTTGQVLVTGQKGEQVLTQAGHGVPLDGSAPPAAADPEKIRKDFADTMAARPKIPVRYLLYFKSDTTLTNDSAALIPKIIEEAETRTAVDVSVIGHTDTVSSEKYNEQLALRRAVRTADLLKTKGLKVNSLTVESHGKRNLLIQTPDNTYEPKNRRVEVSIR